jgi:plastocyanin
MTFEQIYAHTFDTTGSFDHPCTCHPGMQGTVVVQ